MYCPFCHKDQSKVIDSRTIESGATIRRRRECTSCGGRFTTVEKALLIVVKRNGLTEPFSRDKVIVGVKRACQGRDVSEDALKRLAQTVEESVRSHGGSQVHANDIGLAILAPLRELDEVPRRCANKLTLSSSTIHHTFWTSRDFALEDGSCARRWCM